MSTLAAARADNFYYPKDWDPSKGTLNKYHKSHPLGNRAKKIKDGIVVVRYEVPFHIRCTKCDNMYAKGVRFNAEKKCIGKFHSSKIWEFSFKCSYCRNLIKCQTDPENTDYKFVEGAKKWLDTNKAKNDAEFLDLEDEKKKLLDPFFRLEKMKNQKDFTKIENPKINQIIENQDIWKNDYDINCQLRKKFRNEREKFEKIEKEKDIPKNFGIRMATPNVKDLEIAKNVHFGMDGFRKNKVEKRSKIFSESIFKNGDKKVQEINLKISKLPMATKKMLKLQLKNQKKNNK